MKARTSMRSSINTSWVPREPPIYPNVTVTAEAWLNEIRDTPALVDYVLGNVTDLLVPDLLPNIPALALALKLHGAPSAHATVS